jgi:hypothetical protein
MINTTTTPNTTVTLYFTAASGLTNLSTMIILRNGVIATGDSFTLTEFASTGLYTLRYTPSATGLYCFLVTGSIFAYVDVVTKTITTMIKNIEDEAIGSWQWDKVAGTLTMLRQDGSSLATFDVTETLTQATRERTA